MISASRVYAIFLRYIISVRNGDMWRIVETLYWPLLDVLLLGSIGFLTQEAQATGALCSLFATAALWPVVVGVNYEIGVNLLHELEENNFVNLFSTPLNRTEWMLGVMLTGILRSLVVLPATLGVVFFAFKYNLLALPLIPFIGLLIICGWTIGFIASGFLIYWGTHIQQLVWMVGWGMAVVSAVFCPVEALHPWVYAVSKWLPLTQAFHLIKLYYRQGIFGWESIIPVFGSALTFLAVSMAFFMYMFEKSRNQGFK